MRRKRSYDFANIRQGVQGVANAGNGAGAESNELEKNAGDKPAPAGEGQPSPQLDPEAAKKIAALRSRVRESFGNVVMAMMMMPRYRHQTLADLQHLVLEPLIRDRLATAQPTQAGDGAAPDVTGFAIWASVSEEVDSRIQDQIRAGVFPVRLKSEEWTSGSINWLLDVIAPDRRTTALVIANFRQVVKEGSLRLHPIVTRLVDEETLKKMGAEKLGAARKG